MTADQRDSDVVFLTVRSTSIEFERSKTTADRLRRMIEDARFSVGPAAGERPVAQLGRLLADNRELVWSLSAAVLLGLGWAGERIWGWPVRVSIPLYLAAYAFGAWDLVSHTVAAWRKGAFTFDIDLLMLLAALGAAGLGEWAEGAFLLTLFALAHALEHYAMDRARGAIRALADLAPAVARVRREGRDVEVPVEAVRVDEVVIFEADMITAERDLLADHRDERAALLATYPSVSDIADSASRLGTLL